jgi:hypothetical protein
MSTVLNDTPIVGKCIILIYDETDCDDCIKKGFVIMNKLDTLKVANTFVITTTLNPGRHQLLYDYHKYVYVDKQDLIRKELKYITTPVLLLLDEHKQILHALFPGVSTEEENAEFIRRCNN